MTDDPQKDQELLEDDAAVGDAAPLDEEDEIFDGEMEGHPEYDTHQILAESLLDRMHRKAYWHSNQKQLFAFLFANCLFFASAFVTWMRSTPGDPAGDPSTYIRGVDTIRGGLIFALSIYGFWTAVFNIWHAQMKVWPYLLGATLALWVGIGGIMHTVGGEEWDKAIAYKNDFERYGGKSYLDDMMVPLSTIPPAYWLLTAGGLVVAWVIINGILQGSQQAKATKAEEATSGRRRRR